MSKTVRVNVRTAVNSAAIRRERRDGRDVLVVPSATLPDGVVMNGIRYPAEEIAKSFASLDRTPAPLGHPTMNGSFVSASAPEGMVRGFVGAWNENVRQEGGRVLLDKVIDVEFAKQLEGGKAVLNAIEKSEPVHTSTGLLCNLETCNGDQQDGAKSVARNIEFDHDAILLGEDGAATPDQGVGMLVNKAVDQDGKEIEVINSAYDEVDRELDWAADQAARAAERLARAPATERIKSAILEALGFPAREQPLNKGEAEMADEKQLEELSVKVNTLSETVEGLVKGLPDLIGNAVKPLTDNLAEIQNTQKAKDEAEKAVLVNKVVKGGLLSEDDAKATPLNTLRALAPKAEPGKAAALNGAFGGTQSGDEFADYDLNKVIDGEAK
ncbi:hypothetical protein [Leisingera methylohalidivorans]|uniref:Uncharacterized protein n=1 Tax=Leisingera methylohalidivorans DSM 14336 TaxID=999552 RepID=V9VT13_9RHOB|nr:hypothetical protein [Leisingera methylohalidivorans]AHD00470.1 hypothetical protein METH_06825 [Leisingera methylohalidivorans DSM 14336]